MYTVEDIKRNPNILMLFEDELSLELKIEAIKAKPALINSIEEKSLEIIQAAFESGYWNDEIALNLDFMTEDNMIGFVSSATDMYIESFLEKRTTILPEKVAAKLIVRDAKYYANSNIAKSENLDNIVLANIDYMDANTVNPLSYISNLNENIVQTMYNKFGKFALMDIPGKWQTKEMKFDIIEKSIYDYAYIYFDEDVAKLYATDYISTLSYVMQKSKYDPFYDLRVLMILKFYGAALQYVSNQSEEMQLVAVKNNPMAIEYAINPSDDVCFTAIQLDKDCADLIENKSKAVCKLLGIDYVKPSKYSAKNNYLITLSADNMNCYRVMKGDKVDTYLDSECEHDDCKAKKIAKVKEISDEEIKVLKKFGLFKTENPFFDEDELEED